MGRRRIRGVSLMGTRFPPPAPSLDRELRLEDKMIDIDKLPRQEPVVFSMPNQNPDLTKQRKREWYQRNKDEILKRKGERCAAQRKPKPQRPKPAPTPEQIERTRELNRQACNRSRATHLAQVRFNNRVHHHRNRELIVQQQRERRALARKTKHQSPFPKLRALADVCSQRLYELNHGPASEEKETRPPKKSGKPTAVSSPKECGRGRHRRGKGPWPPTILRANRPSQRPRENTRPSNSANARRDCGATTP